MPRADLTFCPELANCVAGQNPCTWVLPYNHNRYIVLQQVQIAQQQLLAMLEENPVNPQLEWKLIHWTTTQET